MFHRLLIIALLSAISAKAQRFRVLALAEAGGHHTAYTKAAQMYLSRLAADSQFTVTYIRNTDSITVQYLDQFHLFLQLDYPPYGWKPAAEKAFIHYLEEGRGGWVGFHHASLLGEFDGFPLWTWFYRFMGEIRFKDYIADFADGEVRVEDRQHPVMQGLPEKFIIRKEEWYTYDKSPRTTVHVLAAVNENSYSPPGSKKMGDHPVIWTNPRIKARNVYIFMGHAPELFNNNDYTKLFSNALFWAAGNH
ncbi:ThuA domain-containing protein [Chitinophaga sp. Mgbs1]|uniref:ThuA domain-containing protein n=1 Tax=Chitinophaga solisilvae TaxID=1233460 RepID=A0A3S1CWW6_9BACT|nr:ThuA domain-containing protein [Chitinophaga solisilvae]